MNKKLLSVSVIAATVATQTTPFIAAQPTVELVDAPLEKTLPNPGVTPVGTPSAGVASTVKRGTQKVLCLMVNFKEQPFQANHNEQFYADSLFGSAPDSVKSYISNQSSGKVVVAPADTKDSPVKGVLKVDLNKADFNGGTIGANEYQLQKRITNAALKQVQDKVDWAKIDSNNDKKFEESFLEDDPSMKEELLVVTVISGICETPTTKTEGQIKAWPHLTELTTNLGDYSFLNSAIIASEKASGNWLNKTILSHEYLHNLNARDMYKDTESVGPWSVMCDTYGKRPGESTTSPTPLDPIHKIYMGWAQPEKITPGEKDIEVPFNKEKVPYLQHPTDPNIVYILDYRDYDDPNQKALNRWGIDKDGMVVWKVNKKVMGEDWVDKDWYLNSKGARTSVGVLSKNNTDADPKNTFIAVGQNATLDGTTLKVDVQNKKLVIKGSSTTPVPPPPPVEEKLTIEAIDRTIKVDDNFNPLEGIVVRNSKNEIVKANVELVKSTVNTKQEGDYIVTVRATYNGVSAEKTYKVKVEKKDVQVKLPVINAENRVITQGDEFKPKEGVTAVDGEGNDITASVKVVETNVKPDVPGVYQVVFEVADKDGNKVTKTITVTVQEANKPNPKPEPNPDPTPGEGEGEQKPGEGEGEQKPNPDDSKPVPSPTKDSIPPVISGVKDAVITTGGEFDPLEGITAKDEKDGEVKVQVMPSKFDHSKPGKYKLTYYAFDKSGNMASYTRLVEVTEGASAGESKSDKVEPELKLYDTSFSFPKGNNINPLSFVKAMDDVDGDLTEKVKIVGTEPDLSKPGNYDVKVMVADKAGNKKEATMKFNIRDAKAAIYAPEINIHEGDKFNVLDGATAISSTGSDLTEKIKADIEGMDTSKPGNYVVTYTVKDHDGTEVKLERKVNVVTKDKDITKPSVKFTQSVFKKGDKFEATTGIESKGKVKLIFGEVDTNSTGIYHLVYEVEGTNGNKIEVVRRVVVLPSELESSAPYVFVFNDKLTVGDKFNAKEAALVVDKEDGLLNNKLLVEDSEVDVNKVGRYTVKYSVIDSDANATSHTAHIDVVAKPLSDPTKPGEAKPSPSPNPGKGEQNKPGENNSTPNPGDNSSIGGSKFPQAIGSLPKTGAAIANTGAVAGIIAYIAAYLRRKFR